MLDVNFDGLLRDEELFGNIPVAIPAGDMSEDFYFSLGEGLIAKVFSQMSRYAGRDAFLSRVNVADRLDEFLRRRALEQVAARPCLERPLDFDIALLCG